MSQFRFYWIDDDEGKMDSYVPVIQHSLTGFPEGSTVQKVLVNKDLLATLNQLTAAGTTQPDLIIIDHVFSRVKLPLKLKGSSVAHLLRGTWPNVPMVCVTAALLDTKKIDQEDISEYTAVFGYKNLDSHIEQIYAIARDFRQITLSKKIREDLAVLVGVPAIEKSTFLRILPSEFDGIGYVTTPHRIAHWIFNQFMVRPGFLYNKLRTATYLGLTESGFDKVKDTFEPARYKGPFYTESCPLWWVSELERVILDVSADDGSTTTQLMGRELPGITPEDFSKCYVSADVSNIPDVVARMAPSNEEQAVCRKFTQKDPADSAINPGFESLLVISNK